MWGSGIGVEFTRRVNDEPQAYDASSFSGISVWLNSEYEVRVEIYSLAERYPGGEDCADTCLPHQAAIPPTTGWQLVQIPFSDFDGTSIDTSDLLQLNFTFPPNSPFAASFDDLKFYE
jgi:hypothetical protein